VIAPHPFSTGAAAQQAHLRILQTTDLHAHVFPFDYYKDHPLDTVGLARTAALIGAARAEVANSILLDNGDLLQGSALGDYMAYDRGLREGDLHPVIAAMNALGYDAATLGNHEFNFGLPFLMAALGRAGFPFISANTLVRRGATPRKGKHLLPPYVILDRKLRDGAGKSHRVQIGILGVLPPQIVTWDESVIGGKIQSRDMVETAAAFIPEMKEAGADIIVLLAHTGIGGAQHHDGMENAAQPLARLQGVDALITGHTHLVFPSSQFAGVAGLDLTRGTIAGTPSVMAGFWGSHLGMIDLLLERDGRDWRVLDSHSMARPIASHPMYGTNLALVNSAPKVLRAAQRDHDATLDYMRAPVGETKRPLHSYFAMIRNCASVQLICQAQAAYVASKLARTAHANLPLLSAAAPFKVGGWGGPDHFTDIQAGPLYQRNLADLYYFPNTICAIRLRGAEIEEWLERSAAAFHRVTPGLQDQPLVNDDFPSYNFDVIYGLTYEIDPSQPARYSVAGQLVNPDAARIRNLRFEGAPLDRAAEFVLATNNYRASTRAAFCPRGAAEVVFSAPVTLRNILLNHVSDAEALAVTPEPNWRLAAMPGTSFVFDSAPRAIRFLPEITDMEVEHLGDGGAGFARFRLHG